MCSEQALSSTRHCVDFKRTVLPTTPILPANAQTLPCVLQAVPFLYELRALLDWTCSATPLNWYQWLKLEDIRASLFIEQCRSAVLAQYLCQGCLVTISGYLTWSFLRLLSSNRT